MSFEGGVGAEPEGFSHGEFRCVVEALNGAAGNGALGSDPVEEQRPVPAQHLGDRLHRFAAGAHGLRAPAIEEAARPGGREVGPEELELLLQEVGAGGPKVVAEEQRGGGAVRPSFSV